jgi:hypothetical protein
MQAFRAASAALSLGLSLALAIPAAPASASPCERHPFFDDGGTLSWTTDTAEAMRRARADGKVVFIEYGRRECTNCRVLVQRMLPTSMCKARMGAAAVGLAADCDEPDASVEALFQRALPRATCLPFAAFVTPDLQWISGWAGSIDPQGILGHLAKAEAWLDRSRVAATPCAAKVPAAEPAPAEMPACAPITNAEIERARSLYAKAQAASAANHPGQVLALEAEAARLRVRADPEGWAALVRAANAWADERIAKAVEEGSAGHCDAARTLVEEVKKEMPAAAQGREAERGQRALSICKAVEALAVENRESARAAAAKEFEGTRWVRLFAKA